MVLYLSHCFVPLGPRIQHNYIKNVFRTAVQAKPTQRNKRAINSYVRFLTG